MQGPGNHIENMQYIEINVSNTREAKKKKNIATEGRNQKWIPNIFLKYVNSKQKTKSKVDTVEKMNGSLATKDADKVEVFSNFY